MALYARSEFHNNTSSFPDQASKQYRGLIWTLDYIYLRKPYTSTGTGTFVPATVTSLSAGTFAADKVVHGAQDVRYLYDRLPADIKDIGSHSGKNCGVARLQG